MKGRSYSVKTVKIRKIRQHTLVDPTSTSYNPEKATKAWHYQERRQPTVPSPRTGVKRRTRASQATGNEHQHIPAASNVQRIRDADVQNLPQELMQLVTSPSRPVHWHCALAVVAGCVIIMITPGGSRHPKVSCLLPPDRVCVANFPAMAHTMVLQSGT